MGRIGRALAGAVVTTVALTACSSATTDGRGSRRPSPPTAPASTAPVSTVPTAETSVPATTPATAPATGTSTGPTRRPRSPAHHPATPPAPRPTASSRHAAGLVQHLPLDLDPHDAQQVITAVGASTSSTRGTLQAWNRVAGGWRRVGPAVPAFFGTAGLAVHPSEQTSGTPVGSFTLTKAFGHDSDPGTALPYTRTTPDDWWISQPGPLYNTRQRCAQDCSFARGAPNEHLFYETPYYDYAVVIDYNTRNAPGGVRPRAGSAFFLHVAVGEPTAGCVSIEKSQLVRLLTWLRPGKSPRILIGTG